MVSRKASISVKERMSFSTFVLDSLVNFEVDYLLLAKQVVLFLVNFEANN